MSNNTAYYGYSIADNSTHDKHNPVIHCVLVGLLIFTAACGCVMGLLSEFDLSVNYPVIIFILLAASLYLALIHISKFIYNAGYIIFLFAFTYALITYRTYANSGFQALLNIINESYSDYYILSSLREYTEIITDRYTTLTVVSVFLGLFLVLLLNVDVFNNMIFATVFSLTFWPLQLGIFIGHYPSYISLALIFFSYFGVYLLRHSGHFFFVAPPKRGKPREYVFDYDDRGGRHIIFHKSNARSMTSLAIFALVASLFFSIFAVSSVSISEDEAILNKSTARTKLDESVKILTQTGIAGMFNRYQAKGGLSGGKLGGVRSVSPDYETDLEVTFVPYSFETLYLKGYTGQEYTSHQWNPPSVDSEYYLNMPSAQGPASRTTLATDRVLHESDTLERLTKAGYLDETHARMRIKNINASTEYLYMPYFLSSIPDRALIEPYSYLKGFSAVDGTVDYDYIPYTMNLSPLIFGNHDSFYNLYTSGDNNVLDDYTREVYNNYLQIPDEIYDELMSYHDEIGTSDKIDEQINLIYRYFLDNFEYNMAPGATPYNRDFVTYFLKEQKRGYCSHFASAGTMLLRSYGIPARYVEGYVVTTSGISETGQGLEEDPAAYYTGNNPLGKSVLLTTEVSDGDAHAWTEVYLDGFGWFPIDLTIPDTGSSATGYGDFINALGRLLQPTDISDNGETDDNSINTPDFDLSTFLNLKNTPVFVLFTWMLILIMLIPLFRHAFGELRDFLIRRADYRNGEYLSSVRHAYKRSSSVLSRIYGRDEGNTIATVEYTFSLIDRLMSQAPDNNPKNSSKKPAVISRIYVLFLELITDLMRKHVTGYLRTNNISAEDILEQTHNCLYSDKKISKSCADLLIGFYKCIE